MKKDEEFKVVLGKKIKHLRALTKTTQMDLAHHLGIVSTGAISQVESGSKGLTVENIQRAAEFFGVHPAVLFSPVEMSADDLAIMRVLLDRIENKNRDSKKAKDYELIQRLVTSVEAA